jgi:hypothetical protein
MPTNDYAARGRVIEVRDEGRTVVFKPDRTVYQLTLRAESPYAGPLNIPIDARLRIAARKVYTVPSGGNFIEPIFGEPRIIQGRVKRGDDRRLVVHAGTPFNVDLPPAPSAIDLNNGPMTVGSLVNVVVMPGASFEWIQETAVNHQPDRSGVS